MKPNEARYPSPGLCVWQDSVYEMLRPQNELYTTPSGRVREVSPHAWGSETDRKSFLQLLWSRWMTPEDLWIKCHMDHDGVFQGKAIVLGAWQVTEAMFKALASTLQLQQLRKPFTQQCKPQETNSGFEMRLNIWTKQPKNSYIHTVRIRVSAYIRLESVLKDLHCVSQVFWSDVCTLFVGFYDSDVALEGLQHRGVCNVFLHTIWRRRTSNKAEMLAGAALLGVWKWATCSGWWRQAETD